MTPRRARTPTPPPAGEETVTDYRHAEKRKHIPPAGLAARGKVAEAPKVQFAYNPHLPPVLRFDPTGTPDRLPELLHEATRRPLTAEEAKLVADALRNHEPWLEWSGKREKPGFSVDPVALHIHERVSAQAILKLAARQPIQRGLFADPELEYAQAVQFYRHDVDWANRLILGDSLTVMTSLARREDLAGKVQMIYMDPPYGIKFASNFQSQVGRRDVKDREEDLTREPEQVKAYRDTWTLGVHSYLDYLRDRLIACKELLADTGSIFVQISDENLHRVRAVMDEVFGPDNFVAQIAFVTSTGRTSATVPVVNDYLLWYARSLDQIKYRTVGTEKDMQDGDDEIELAGLNSQGESANSNVPFEFEGRVFYPPKGRHWSNTPDPGMKRLAKAERLVRVSDTQIRAIRYRSEKGPTSLTALWTDTQFGAFAGEKLYVVQTNTKIAERCLLMTTDPGDLVLDPTCGSGTTAYVAEQWGRRWITIDTSRVAVALARQRLLTAKFDYYALAGGAPAGEQGSGGAGGKTQAPSRGFVYKKVPHITLKSIAQNQALDPIFAEWEPKLKERVERLAELWYLVTPEVRAKLAAKLEAKTRVEGKSAITEADRRRWLLPQRPWREWEIPFDTDPDWPRDILAVVPFVRTGAPRWMRSTPPSPPAPRRKTW